MATIENKTTSIKLTEDTNVRYSDLLQTVVNKPVKEGISLKDMKRNLAIMDILEKAGDTLEFTKDQFDFVATEVENSVWAVNHLDILEFAEYIESLK